MLCARILSRAVSNTRVTGYRVGRVLMDHAECAYSIAGCSERSRMAHVPIAFARRLQPGLARGLVGRRGHCHRRKRPCGCLSIDARRPLTTSPCRFGLSYLNGRNFVRIISCRATDIAHPLPTTPIHQDALPPRSLKRAMTKLLRNRDSASGRPPRHDLLKTPDP